MIKLIKQLLRKSSARKRLEVMTGICKISRGVEEVTAEWFFIPRTSRSMIKLVVDQSKIDKSASFCLRQQALLRARSELSHGKNQMCHMKTEQRNEPETEQCLGQRRSGSIISSSINHNHVYVSSVYSSIIFILALQVLIFALLQEHILSL